MRFFFLSIIAIISLCIAQFIFPNSAFASDNNQLFLVGANENQRGGIMPFSSQQDVVVSVDGSGKNDVIVDIYESDMDSVLDFLTYEERDDEYGNTMRMLKSHKPKIDSDKVATISVKTGDTFSVPMEKTGIRLLHAHSTKSDTYAFVVRSNIGVLAESGSDKMIFWAQNMDTKRSVSGVKIKIYVLNNHKDKKISAETNVQGIAETAINSSYDVATACKGDDCAIIPINMQDLDSYAGPWSMNFAQYQPYIKHFLFTDRTLYKPGDTIHFKSVAREDDDVHYKIPSGQWNAQAVYGWGDKEKIVASQIVEVDAHGSLTGELHLPQDIQTGQYRLLLEKVGQGSVAHNWLFRSDDAEVYFQVEHYRKPAQTVSVSLEQNEQINGQDIVAHIEGKYFSGEPLANEHITYTVYAQNSYDGMYYDNFVQQRKYYQYYGLGGIKIYTDVTTLDSEGQTTVILPTKITDGKMAVYTVEVSYEPSQGEPVIDQEKVLVHAGDYEIFRTDHTVDVVADTATDIGTQLYKNNSDATVVQQKLTIKQKRIWWEKKMQRKNGRHWYNYERKEEKLRNLEVITDNEGKATIKFHPSKAGSYDLTVRATDAHGNKIIKEFHVWVSDNGVVYNNDNVGLNIIAHKDIFVPGKAATFDIVSDVANRDVFVSVSRNFVQDYHVVHINGMRATVQLPIKYSYMPRMRIMAQSFSVDTLDHTEKEIAISAEQQKLHIDVTTDKKQYSPGDTVTATITTTDSHGAPQKADVALWAIDKSILELAEATARNIFAIFWEYRYGYTYTTHSLRGITVNMAEGGGCFTANTKVLMADGTERSIQDIRAEDKIMTRTTPQDAQLVAMPVRAVHSTRAPGFLVINNKLHVTQNHLLRVNHSWKRADSIKIGDTLSDTDGHDVAVTSLQWIAQKTTVYNLNVNDKHTYFADGIYVHNGKGGGVGRSIFKDTAYWNPHVVTNNDGEAAISFVLPDDLTTWSIAAIGATDDTKVGEAITEIISQQQYILRPSLPNILRIGDQVYLASSVQNLSDTQQKFEVELKVGKQLYPKKTVTIDAGGKTIVSWEVNTSKFSTATELPVIFSMYSVQQIVLDRVTKHIPIERFGFWETRSFAGYGVKIPYKLDLPRDARNQYSQFSLTVSSTLLHSLRSSAQYLFHYPYGCMEQTVSRFVPALLAKEHPRVLRNIAPPDKIDDMLAKGVERLAHHQNDDGGWSWWSDNISDKFISLYIAEYLIRAQNVGVDTGDVIDKVRDYFAHLSPVENDVENVLSLAGQILLNTPAHSHDMILLDQTMPLDIIAVGVMANVRNSYTDSSTNGVHILRSLLQNADGRTWWINKQNNNFGAHNTPSAMALRAFMDGGGDMDTARKVVWTLRDSHTTDYWYNTFATAQIFEAFVQFAQYDIPQQIATHAIVDIAHTPYKELTFSDEQPVQELTFSADDFLGKDNLEVSSRDASPVYSTLFMKLFRTDDTASAVSRGITITRTYSNVDKEKEQLELGDMVDIALEVSGLQQGYQYLVIEDQLPTGLAVVNEHLKNIAQKDRVSDVQCGYKEYTKNGIIISCQDTTAPSRIFHYRARVVSLGEFCIPPATASLMYSPDIYSRTSAITMSLLDNKLDYHTAMSPMTNVAHSLQELLRKYGYRISAGLVILAISIVGYALWRRIKRL